MFSSVHGKKMTNFRLNKRSFAFIGRSREHNYTYGACFEIGQNEQGAYDHAYADVAPRLYVSVADCWLQLTASGTRGATGKTVAPTAAEVPASADAATRKYNRATAKNAKGTPSKRSRATRSRAARVSDVTSSMTLHS